QEWNEITQKFENVDNSKFSTIVKGNETITLLVPNTNGTFTYYNEGQIGADGQPKLGETGVTIDPKEVSVSLNTTTNKYEFKNSQGDVIGEIDTNANAIAFDDSKSNLGADNVQDAIDNLLSKVGSGAGVTLVDNNDGTITLKSDDNTVLGTVSKGSLTNNNDGTYTYDNGNGTPVTFDTNAKAIAFDNSTNGFTSTNVQEALE
ncbi:hypothetical protein AAEZ63_13555, partial [Myroides sp. C2723]